MIHSQGRNGMEALLTKKRDKLQGQVDELRQKADGVAHETKTLETKQASARNEPSRLQGLRTNACKREASGQKSDLIEIEKNIRIVSAAIDGFAEFIREKEDEFLTLRKEAEPLAAEVLRLDRQEHVEAALAAIRESCAAGEREVELHHKIVREFDARVAQLQTPPYLSDEVMRAAKAAALFLSRRWSGLPADRA
jgi:hypothetical protein